MIRFAYGWQDGCVLVEQTHVGNDHVQIVAATSRLKNNIHQFPVMDRAAVRIVEVTTNHEATQFMYFLLKIVTVSKFVKYWFNAYMCLGVPSLVQLRGKFVHVQEKYKIIDLWASNYRLPTYTHVYRLFMYM